MKSFFEERPNRKFLLLAGFAVLIGLLIAHESSRYLKLQKRILATAAAITQAKEKEALLLEEHATTAENLELLAQYEERIPVADNGYVWVSRAVRDAVPEMALKINPPQFEGHQLPLSPDYCCGSFDVRGSGRLDELLQILQKVESDLPFARVQDLHFSCTEEHVTFSFTLLAIMRLERDSES